MGTERIVVLANSMKKGGRCVAGRVVSGPGAFGRWVRPIGCGEAGALLPDDMRTADRGPINVLDVFDVPVAADARDACHPEDRVVGREPWRRVGAIRLEDATKLQDRPLSLWLENPREPDRFSCEYHRKLGGYQSIYLVRPEGLHLCAWQEYNAIKGLTQKKVRAVFRYRCMGYTMSLTDPAFTARHPIAFPDVGKPKARIRLPGFDDCLVCVSVTPLFNGCHYKVAATVLELP